MNRIFVSRDKIATDSNNVFIDKNIIKINDSGVYSILYEDIESINVSIYVSDLLDVTLLESSFLGDIKVNNKYIIDNSSVMISKFYYNDSVSEKIDISLYNRGKIDYKFSNICRNKEDYEININHLGKSTSSSINNKSVALGGSKINFVINSIVAREYENSVLDQNTRIVTFSDSEAKISPNMFIDCDDIEARHGSIIGEFKDDLVFYLMSRGILYNDAIKLLVKGYLFSNIVVDLDLREKILNIIDMYWR